MDVHVRRAVTAGLRPREIDVLTAQEDGAAELDAAQLLDRATSLGRVVFTQDRDFLREGHRAPKNRPVLFRHSLCPSDRSYYRPVLA